MVNSTIARSPDRQIARSPDHHEPHCVVADDKIGGQSGLRLENVSLIKGIASCSRNDHTSSHRNLPKPHTSIWVEKCPFNLK